jgi:hypothetical protein
MSFSSSRKLELDVTQRIISRFKLINGTGNYILRIPFENIFSEFKTISEITAFPALCLGSLNIGPSEGGIRDKFDFPLSIEFLGYTYDVKAKAPAEDIAALAHDCRFALCSDEFLNNKIQDFAVRIETGTIERQGFLFGEITGSFEHILVEA